MALINSLYLYFCFFTILQAAPDSLPTHYINITYKLTSFSLSDPPIIITPELPLPCKAPNPDLMQNGRDTEVKIFQIHPHSSGVGMMFTCLKRTSWNSRTWYGAPQIDQLVEIKIPCNSLPDIESSRLNDTIIDPGWKILNVHISKPYRLTIYEESYPYFSTEFVSYFAIVTRIPYTRSVRGSLIDPFPDNPCSEIPCALTAHTQFYSHDWLNTKSGCTLIHLSTVFGTLSVDPDKLGARFSSASSFMDLNFHPIEQSEVQCREEDYRVYLSREGVFAGFKVIKNEIDELERVFGVGPSHNADLRMLTEQPRQSIRRQRDLDKSNQFDLIPLSQQNVWIYSHQSLEESNLMFLMRKANEANFKNILFIRHMICLLQRTSKIAAFHLVDSIPIPYLRFTFPNEVFLVMKRKPLTVRKGTYYLLNANSLNFPFQLSSPGFLYSQRHGLHCEKANITGVISCGSEPPKELLNLTSSFYLPSPMKLWINIKTKEVIGDEELDHNIQNPNIVRQWTSPSLYYEKDSGTLRDLESSIDFKAMKVSQSSVDNLWESEIGSVVSGLKSMIKIVVYVALFGIALMFLNCLWALVTTSVRLVRSRLI